MSSTLKPSSIFTNFEQIVLFHVRLLLPSLPDSSQTCLVSGLQSDVLACNVAHALPL